MNASNMYLNWTYGCQNNFNVSGCSTLFLSACRALKAWFESSRINLYGSDLKGNKNYFELAGGSSYRGYNNRKCMKEINPGEIDFGSS